MGKKPEPKKQRCSACQGNGGHWEVPNGNGLKKRRWRTCTFCKGKKYV